MAVNHGLMVVNTDLYSPRMPATWLFVTEPRLDYIRLELLALSFNDMSSNHDSIKGTGSISLTSKYASGYYA